MLQVIIAVLIALLNSTGTVQETAPTCWEDEVVVMVVSDPYGDLEGTLGCVPADNLPVDGFRP